MLSVDQGTEPAPKPLAWLRSQGFGFICGMSTVALLAVGSVVLVATREGASRGVALDDIRVFFAEPSWVHTWFYILMVVLFFYGINVTLATWDSVVRKWQMGVRDLRAYATAFFHVGFLFAMLAHLLGGTASEDAGRPLIVGSQWTDVGDGRKIRVLDIRADVYETQQMRGLDVDVEVEEDGRTSKARIEYNVPLSTGFGADLLLIAGTDRRPVAARIMWGETKCELAVGERCELDGNTLTLLDLKGANDFHSFGVLARVTWRSPSGDQGEGWLPQGHQGKELLGVKASLIGANTEAVVVLRHRKAPGNPVALVSALIMMLAVLLFARRLTQRMA